MNIQTSDECKTRFDEVKFRKIDARYIVYQIVNEKLVISIIKTRSSRESAERTNHGNNSSTHFLTKSTVTACLIWNSSTTTKWPSVK